MYKTSHHGWIWAYRKLRGHHCSRSTSCYRATLYIAFGDTGKVKSEDRWVKIRLSRKPNKKQHSSPIKTEREMSACNSAQIIGGRSRDRQDFAVMAASPSRSGKAPVDHVP